VKTRPFDPKYWGELSNAVVDPETFKKFKAFDDWLRFKLERIAEWPTLKRKLDARKKKRKSQRQARRVGR
jgi:hypothetical protein